MTSSGSISVPRYSRGHELANRLTHGVSVALSIAGLAVLVSLAARRGNAWHVVSCGIYGATLIALFLASTLYHSFTNPRVKRVLRVMDHASIYLLIAGSYTPFLLVNLRGPWGWSLFGIVWGLAVIGIVLKVFFTGRFRYASTAIYLAMGWMIVIAIRPLARAVPTGGMMLLLTGGVLYTGGAVLYLFKRLPYHHAIWHLFVLAAAVAQYFAVMFYVVPR
ncbi:MAG: hemolysin III family protein [Verrucomicrobia bacterium]|nr:hemolysin III family protein [Verrucomicrobiota bacterium]MBU1910630.1 hemolysin III family protein [Verrucomicrobiota bacterium]